MTSQRPRAVIADSDDEDDEPTASVSKSRPSSSQAAPSSSNAKASSSKAVVSKSSAVKQKADKPTPSKKAKSNFIGVVITSPSKPVGPRKSLSDWLVKKPEKKQDEEE